MLTSLKLNYCESRTDLTGLGDLPARCAIVTDNADVQRRFDALKGEGRSVDAP
jgi:hypothetical protein